MSNKVKKNEVPTLNIDEIDITQVDPTKIGGLDNDVAQEFDEDSLEWTKSRGKRKEN